MNRIILFLVIGFFSYSLSWAQIVKKKNAEPIFAVHLEDSTMMVKQFGMNISPLLVQLIPLNRGTIRTGPYGFNYASINHKNKVFRLGLGAWIDDFENDSHLNLRIGIGKLRKISEKWHLMTGWDLMAFGGNLNLPESGTLDDGGIGIAPFMGIQYYVIPNVCVGTEGAFFMGITANTPLSFRALPPVGVFVHVNFAGEANEQSKRRAKLKEERLKRRYGHDYNSKPFIRKKKGKDKKVKT
ncbi:MAG: hypothetical protein AB8B69_25180 [Chitinophagales bacterium]